MVVAPAEHSSSSLSLVRRCLASMRVHAAQACCLQDMCSQPAAANAAHAPQSGDTAAHQASATWIPTSCKALVCSHSCQVLQICGDALHLHKAKHINLYKLRVHQQSPSCAWALLPMCAAGDDPHGKE